MTSTVAFEVVSNHIAFDKLSNISPFDRVIISKEFLEDNDKRCLYRNDSQKIQFIIRHLIFYQIFYWKLSQCSFLFFALISLDIPERMLLNSKNILWKMTSSQEDDTRRLDWITPKEYFRCNIPF